MIESLSDLTAWVLSCLRYSARGEAAQRWLLMDDDGAYGPRLSRMERPSRFARSRKPYEERRSLGTDLHARLARRWPTQRNGGRTHLTPAGILDLLDPAGCARVRSEAVRLARLDEERDGRFRRAEHAAEQTFAVLDGVPARADRTGPDHTCRSGGHTWAPCSGCAKATDARIRADERAARWLREPCQDLDGRRPDDLARESEESLVRVLWLLQGMAAEVESPVRAKEVG